MEEKQKKSLEQIVYEKLRGAILHRALVPGTQLIESYISDKMKVSRTPIRYAIKRLASEGFVTVIPNRGAFIVKPTLEEILQAYVVRTELECVALKYSMHMIGDDDIALLHDLVNKESAAISEKNYFDYFTYNKEFHLIFAKKVKNKFLIDFLEKIIDQINIYMLIYNAYHSTNIEGMDIEEHQQMIELIKSKSFDKLEGKLRVHLDNSLNELKLNQVSYKSLDEIF